MIDIYPYFQIVLIGILLILVIIIFSQRIKNRKLERLLTHTHNKLERLQLHFGRFTPPEVIEQFTEPDGIYEAKMTSVTVLFADLKGFTKMCEKMEPSTIVSILNGYFRCMSEAISKHHGQVTELMGDGILALFGAVRNNPWQEQDAVMGALSMRQALENYNKELRLKSLPELSFGIGIHQGEVLVGIMGNFELSKFGVVGDAINVASRVESLTRIHDADLLITETVKEKLDNRFILRVMPATAVKGKEKPIVTYAVDGIA
jgi:adenylate cyclase